MRSNRSDLPLVDAAANACLWPRQAYMEPVEAACGAERHVDVTLLWQAAGYMTPL